VGLHLDVRSRALPSGSQGASTTDTLRAAGTAVAAGTVVSGAFHAFGPPKLAIAGRPWATATFGVGAMAGLATAAVYATNHGALHGGKRTNSMLESTLISAAAFAIPGTIIHGKMNFSGKPVSTLAATAGVALIGAMAGPIIHELTLPDR
jgi:hypothetical protein